MCESYVILTVRASLRQRCIRRTSRDAERDRRAASRVSRRSQFMFQPYRPNISHRTLPRCIFVASFTS
jgi:hypothetical protein